MASQGKDSDDGLEFSDGGDGVVQFIEAPKVNQPRFLTLNRDSQVIPMISTIPLWLSNSINKKRSLQPVSTPVKNIVTKYVARGSKEKKIKTYAYLTKDPMIGKITMEVATYKQKKEFGEVDEEGFKVTSIELGTINLSTGNNFFKFSTDHMLTQLEKDIK